MLVFFFSNFDSIPIRICVLTKLKNINNYFIIPSSIASNNYYFF
jgi:hypothetical protein